jgi:hypothetical protein
MVQQDPRRFRLDGGVRLRFTQALPEAHARIDFVEELLARLARRIPAAPGARSR